MNFKGFGGGGMNRQVQENIARDQLRAVNKAGKARVEAKQRHRATLNERRELLKTFHTGELVNNGREIGRIVDSQLDPPVLVVKLSSGKRVTWAPDVTNHGSLHQKE